MRTDALRRHTDRMSDDVPSADQRALLNALAGVFNDLHRLVPAEPEMSPLGRRVRSHLGVPIEELPLVTESVPSHRLVDADLALDALAEGGSVFGIAANGMREHETFTSMLSSGSGRFRPGAADYALVGAGPDRKRRVIAFGVRLFSFEGSPVAVLQRAANPQYGRASATLEIIGTDEGSAEGLVAAVRRLMRERSVLRGQVLSFSGGDFDDSSAGATFHTRERIDPDSIVLSPGVLDDIRRHVVEIGQRREQLLAAGQHLKRGVLLYGPPGTGKTLTVRHLVGASEGTTVVLLAGRTIQFISEAAELARTLQPALVVLEDIDLIAQDRSRMGPQPLLFAVLDALDGLGGDADVTFLMTTNRVDQLERALAERPGRVDLAVEVPLPEAAERERLFALYGGGLGLSAESLRVASLRAEGTTASFAKELMRRVVLTAAAADRAVENDDLVRSLDALLSDRETLTRSLLGAGGAPEPVAADEDDGADGIEHDGSEVVVTASYIPQPSRRFTSLDA